MNRLWSGLGLIAIACAAVACGGGEASKTGSDQAAWGALNDPGLIPSAPMYLMNKTRGEGFRVCLPEYMSTMYPGIEIEIDAAINVWASYLGRSIPVTVVTKPLPRATASQSVDDLATAYEAICGDGFDVVMGLANLTGAIVGLTSPSYQYLQNADGSIQVTSFKRYLFIRDYDLAPDTDPDGNPATWTSLQARSGQTWTRDQLLSTMTARATTQYATKSSFLVLPVITHEYGHVWGLCDQYEGSTNCDPMNSTSHLVLDSMMGAHGGTEHLYLTDDDIEGVRALDARPGFAHDWGTAPTTPGATIPVTDVELARIESVARTGTTLAVTYGVVTPRAATVSFELLAAGSTTWEPLQSNFPSTSAIDDPTARLDITVGATDPNYEVRMTVTPTEADGSQGTPVVVTSN